ncbi:MAG: DUF541 domain-containing protein [Thermoplasmata archaeon]|jgi:hypothetical protein|nr:DUF541 domain-containing protein [Thermoplasmata archaeon]
MRKMARTITVKGRAMVKSPADMTVVRASVEGIAPTFSKALEAVSESTTLFKDAAQDAGIKRDTLKTSNFSVSQHFKEKKVGVDKDGRAVYKKFADGFSYHQDFRFEFPNDNGLLTKLVNNILDNGIAPRIHLDFVNSDPEAAKNEALRKATENATKEARMIVEAAGARLGRLLEVKRGGSYDYDDYDEGYRSRSAMECCSNICANIDIDPEDVSTSDSVTLTWEIEDRNLRGAIPLLYPFQD